MKFILFALLLLLPFQASAQDVKDLVAPAPETAIVTDAPVVVAADEPGSDTLEQADIQGQVVLELFSSQACVFCPKADQLLGDLSSMDNVIALSCHVDYYDVNEGSLSRPFCTTRQGAYASTLRSGPTYTPQMVVNGAYDVVGYRLDDISKIVKKASNPGPLKIGVEKIDEPARYKINLPLLETPKIIAAENIPVQTMTDEYDLWIAFIDKQHEVKIADGGNKGIAVTYHDIVSDLFKIGTWDGKAKTMQVNLKTLSRNESFVVIAQKPGGEIVAVRKVLLNKAPEPEEKEDSGVFDFFGLFDD